MDRFDILLNSGLIHAIPISTSSNQLEEASKAFSNFKEFHLTSLNDPSTQCASISESLQEDPEFNLRLLKAVEGYIHNSTRLIEITKSLKELNFLTFKGLSSSTPLGSATILTVTQSEVHATVGGEFREIELEVKDVEKAPEHEPQDTKPILITIVRPITKPALEVEMIESSSRLQLTVNEVLLVISIPYLLSRFNITLNSSMSLSEQSLSELPSSSQLESTRKTQPSVMWHSVKEVSEPKKKVIGSVSYGNRLTEPHMISST
ncbi:hypothetical protein Tco_0432481 [Tanacetum coccineum]